MRTNSSYAVELKNANRIFNQTVRIYQSAIKFCLSAFENEWDNLKDIESSKYQAAAARNLIHSTSKNTAKYQKFDRLFYKLPCYLLTNIINTSIGILNSYHTQLDAYNQSDKQGNSPRLQFNHNTFPTFYRNNMSLYTMGADTIQLKLFIDNDWRYMTFRLKHTDVNSILKHILPGSKVSCPTMEKRNRKWFLQFNFEDNVLLNKTPIHNQSVLAVDLGINTCAVCAVMRYDGTVTARKFIDFPVEKDHLNHLLNKIKNLQRRYKGHNTDKMWRRVKNLNTELAKKTADEIAKMAVNYNVSVIVFEHLDMNGRKSGSKKQRLHMWNKCTIQDMTTTKAHKNGIRISRICARYTSKLAFDGSGLVIRGKDAGFKTNQICRFPNGKVYNCDLSASYNIGARYFIREIEKFYTLKPTNKHISLWSDIQTKVPDISRRTQNTLSTLKLIHQCIDAA